MKGLRQTLEELEEQNDREHGYLVKLILINYFVEIVMLIFLIIKG